MLLSRDSKSLYGSGVGVGVASLNSGPRISVKEGLKLLNNAISTSRMPVESRKSSFLKLDKFGIAV